MDRLTEPRHLSHQELEDIVGYEADFYGASYKPTTTFLMARELLALRAEHATLMSMVEKAASTLRDFAEEGDDDDPVDAGIRQKAKRTLKAMREIGGFDG